MAVIGYEGQEDPAKTQIGDNPNHKQLMAWGTQHGGQKYRVQYHHGSLGFGTAEHNYVMHTADDKYDGDKFVGTMGLKHDGEISHIEIHPEARRQGLATKLYKFAKGINEDIPSIPAPKHSESRTESGDAWAHAVGGALPESRSHVEDHNYRSNRWQTLRDATIPDLKSHLNEFHAKLLENGVDDEGTASARFHVDSAHDYLDQAAKVGKDHPHYSTHMMDAHDHIDELGELQADWGHGMEPHEKLQEHIGRLY